MPELPEIETLVRDLRRTIAGKEIVDVHAGQPKAINMPPAEFRQRVHGRVEGIDRLGKSAIVHLANGDLWLHMGLRGKAEFLPDAPWPAANFLSLRFADGSQLTVDKSFMGHAYFVAKGAQPPGGKLGLDALDPALSAERFAALLKRKPAAAVKAALMDQSLIAGVGNTYSDEILWRARLHPGRRIASLTDREIDALYRSLRDELREAVAMGGEGDWIDLGGKAGQHHSEVHEAASCGRCGGPIEVVTAGSRTGYFCPTCQPNVPSSAKEAEG